MPPSQRWYDSDLFLKTLVYSLERMSQGSQVKLARVLCQLCDRLLAMRRLHSPIKRISPEKIAALRTGKARKKRWYDQDTVLYKTFNRLYVLDEETRSDIAHQFFGAAQIIWRYELYCQRTGQHPDQNVISEILRSNLKEGPERTLRLYGFYLDCTLEAK